MAKDLAGHQDASHHAGRILDVIASRVMRL
jgi:hypothetical protein